MARRAARTPESRAVESSSAGLPGPERTCVGCRARAAKATLLRVVAVEDQGIVCLAPDPDGRLPGRGAHVHPDLRCVELAGKRRAFGRALRLDHGPDLEPLREHLRQVHDRMNSTDSTPSTTSSPPDESRSTTS